MKLVPCSALMLVLFGVSAFSQSTNPLAMTNPRSHVERFSTPVMRAEKTESETNSKLAANPNDDTALNDRALARMRLNRYQEACEDLRRAVFLKPQNSEYEANLGYALWRLGRAAEAVSAEREAIKLDDKNYTAHYQLGRFLLRLGDPALLEEGAAHLRRALEIDPRQYETRFELVATYRAMGNLELALAQFELLQDARPSDARVLYIGALLAVDRKDMKSAISSFQEALRRDSSLIGAWQDLGLAYIKLSRWAEAAETFAELVKRQSDSPDAAYFHALALFNSGKPSEAEREVRRALRLNAGDSASLTLLGIVLATRMGGLTDAADALAQAVSLAPDSFDANFYLGRVQYMMKDYASAVQSLRTSVRLNPRDAEARFFLGTALETMGDLQGAMNEYQKLIEIDSQSAMGQIGLGALRVKEGKIEEAVSALKRAITLDAKSFEAHWALGRALMLAERFAEATEVLQVAVSLSPERSDAHYQLGLAFRRLGRTNEANREFAIVDRLNTEFRTNKPTKP